MANDSVRYETVLDETRQDIIAGIGEKKDVVKTASTFLQDFSQWVIEFIEAVKKFFESLKSAKS